MNGATALPPVSPPSLLPLNPLTEHAAPLRVVLINPYELGRQSFALGEAAAWLTRVGCAVQCLDLALQRLDAELLGAADLIALHLGMHTATRIAQAALPRIRALAPRARLAAFGLYAPVNAGWLHAQGVDYVYGGECEPLLAGLAQALARGEPPSAQAASPLDRIEFLPPQRELLPPLERYAQLVLPGGERRMVGFADASRGCKHLCRHCPVVPVYGGRFRIVPVDVVLADIRAQIAAGARHISFGDADFLNGPTHALRIVRALHAEFPPLSFDATIKIEHLLQHADMLPELKAGGCLFVISAVESVDDAVLARLEKGHTRADFERAVALLREAGIALAPTFVSFTPWTTRAGYLDLLRMLVRLHLVEAVPPVQLIIRLLVPAGSALLAMPDFEALVQPFDAALLGYPWRHADPALDALQQELAAWVAQAEAQALPRRAVFAGIWQRAHAAAGQPAPALPDELGAAIPHLSEPWYCCAEPTDQQLQAF